MLCGDYLLKEATSGCVIGFCSNLISEFTYWLSLEQIPSEKVLCIPSECASCRRNEKSDSPRWLSILWYKSLKAVSGDLRMLLPVSKFICNTLFQLMS